MPLLPATAPAGVSSIAYRCPSCCDCPVPLLVSDDSVSSVAKCGFGYEGEDTVYLTSIGPGVLGGTPDVTTYDPATCIPTTTPGTEGCSVGWFVDGVRYLRRTTTWEYGCAHSTPWDPELYPNAPGVASTCTATGTVTRVEEYLGLIFADAPPEGSVYPSGYDENDLCRKYTTVSGSVTSLDESYGLTSSSLASDREPESINDTLCSRIYNGNEVTISTSDYESTWSITGRSGLFYYAACNNGTDQDFPGTPSMTSGTGMPPGDGAGLSVCSTYCYTETFTYGAPISLDPGGYSNEFTFEMLQSKLEANFSGFLGTLLPGTGNSVVRYLSPDGASLTESRLKYAFIFQPPPGRAYRVRWIERTLAVAGAGLSGLDVWAPGCCRPHVWAPAYGGSPTDPTVGVQLTAIMGTDGSVVGIEAASAFPSVTEPFAVEIEAPVGGGVQSTGWVGTVGPDRTVTFARTGGSAGNYLPALTVASGGAEGTLVMDPRGGIASVNITVAGSGYVEPPNNLFHAEPRVSVLRAYPVFAARLGSEVERCASWSGVVPGDYDPLDQATWPQVPAVALDLVPGEGTDTQRLIVNIRADCTGDTCP